MPASISSAASVSQPRKAASISDAYGAMLLPVASVTDSSCAISEAAAPNSPASRCGNARMLSAIGIAMRRAGLTDQLDVALRQHIPAAVVPDQLGGVACLPQPAEPFLPGDLVAAERADRLFEHRRARRVAVGGQQRQTVQQQISRPRRPRRRGRPTRGLGRLPQAAGGG